MFSFLMSSEIIMANRGKSCIIGNRAKKERERNIQEMTAIMSTNKTSDMTAGSPVKLIIRFMIPMCLGNIFQQFYNIADSIVAGQFIGVDALAAIGSTGSLMFFVT